MTQHATLEANGFDWIDLTDPTAEELTAIAERYNLHPQQIEDCLQPGHLPKYEQTNDYLFIIFRIHVDNELSEADNVRELTNKVAIFCSDSFLITIHRQEHGIIHNLAKQMHTKPCGESRELLNLLLFACLATYEKPLDKLSRSVDYFEEIVFLRPKKAPLLKGLYYVRRKTELIKRILILSFEIIDAIDSEQGNVNTRDLRDQYVKLRHMFDALDENIHQLLSIYFSASSQRTNETMRVLTIFSVFFMPLTFIVGVYGMNFHYMPELTWKLGYPGVMILMALVTLLIYLWFRKKNWL